MICRPWSADHDLQTMICRPWSADHDLHLIFDQTLIFHQVETKKITTMKDVWIPALNWLAQILTIFFSIYSLVFVSIEKIYQTLETVFHRISKHLEFPQKCSAARRIFNSLLGVWIYRWNTISRVWYITSRVPLENRFFSRSSFPGKLFPVLSQATIYIFSLRTGQKVWGGGGWAKAERGWVISFWTLGKGWVVQFLATRGGWVILFLLWELTHIWHNLQQR